MSNSRQSRGIRIAGTVAYLALFALCAYNWFAAATFAMSMAQAAPPKVAISLFHFTNAAVIISIPLAPVIFSGGNFFKRITVAAALSFLILFGFPLGWGAYKSVRASIAQKDDITITDYEWPGRVAYYSHRNGNECGNICVQLLYGGYVEEFAAFKLNNKHHRQVARSNNNLPENGRVYAIKKSDDCISPKTIGLNSESNYIVMLRAALGECLTANATSRDSYPTKIIYESASGKYANGFHAFHRLSIVNENGSSQHQDSGLIARKTEVGYLTIDAPFIGMFFRYVRSGGARILGQSRGGEYPRINALTLLEATGAVALKHKGRNNQQTQTTTREKPVITEPSELEVVSKATDHLEKFDGAEGSLTPIMKLVLKAGLEHVRSKRFREQNQDASRAYIEAALDAAAIDLKSRSRSPTSNPHGNTIIRAAFKGAGLKYTKHRPYTYFYDIDIDRNKIENFETALFQYVIAANDNDIANKSARISSSVSYVVSIAGEVLAMQTQVDPTVAHAYWSMTLRAYNHNATLFLSRHGAILPSAADDVLMKLLPPADRLAGSDADNWFYMLNALPDDRVKRNKGAFLKLIDLYIDDISVQNAQRLLIQTSIIGDDALPALETYLNHEKEELRVGSIIGVCKIGRPISDEVFMYAVAELENISGRWHNGAERRFDAAIKLIARSGRLDDLARILSAPSSTHGFEEKTHVKLKGWIAHPRKIGPEHCDFRQ